MVMARGKAKGNPVNLAIVAAVVLILTAVLLALRPPETVLNGVIRATALVGYVAVFLAIVSSAYLRQMVRLFGGPFLKVHHGLAASGLILLTIHALGVALRLGSLSAFLPDFSSLRTFLLLAGRPAWFLLVAGAMAATWRATLGRKWRALHALVYVAFVLGTVHGILIGTDFQFLIVRIVSAAMGLVVVAVFVHKRLSLRKG
jgi:DMSO/TMAO reductase YedYZ heme-binding membrane subunit